MRPLINLLKISCLLVNHIMQNRLSGLGLSVLILQSAYTCITDFKTSYMLFTILCLETAMQVCKYEQKLFQSTIIQTEVVKNQSYKILAGFKSKNSLLSIYSKTFVCFKCKIKSFFIYFPLL